MKTIWIRQSDRAFAEWLSLREKVLRLPLGLSYSADDLREEVDDRHLLSYLDGKLAGGLAVREVGDDGRVWKVRQVAVAPELQGKGIGRKLMLAVEEKAREEGVCELVLHSRGELVPFYEAIGFCAEGEPFVEVGIPHRRMRKRLS